jgi:hypothetical protein
MAEMHKTTSAIITYVKSSKTTTASNMFTTEREYTQDLRAAKSSLTPRGASEPDVILFKSVM